MYYRKVNDPISPHSERLVSYMNTHPATILGYAKYYGEIRSAVSARMVDIDSNGFMVEVEEENGSKSEVHIKFKIRLRSYEEVRPTLTRMAQEAEDALGLPNTRPPPTFSGSSSQNLTSHTPFILPGIADLLITTFSIVFLLTVAFYFINNY